MAPDRSWMLRRKDSFGLVSEEFQDGVEEFLNLIKSHDGVTDSTGTAFCPCLKCRNLRRQDSYTISEHLYNFGFVPLYANWTIHGEDRWLDGCSGTIPTVDVEDVANPYVDMLVDAIGEGNNVDGVHVDEEPNPGAAKFYKLLADADEPLWDGCEVHTTEETVLSSVTQLLNLKSEFNMSESCFDRMMVIIKRMMPATERLPNKYYHLRRLVDELGLGYKKIDACVNHCMLYYGDDSDKRVCHCGKKRYKEVGAKSSKKKEVPVSQLRYFPIIPRLQRLFMSKKTAKHMCWHATGVREDESLVTHPSDGEAWKHFDLEYPEFAAETRNVRLGLCTDGFNPFGGSAKSYSCWPVFLTPYNLPPSMCLKREHIFLSLLVPGPRAPGKSIDVYLRPLIDELKLLWEVGVLTFDACKRQNFMMRANLMWTISDFPAYGMLSGWSTHGGLACPYCMDQTKSFRLFNSHKWCWFDCHRQHLSLEHPYRRDANSFYKGKVEKSLQPEQLSGQQLLEVVNKLPPVKFGLRSKKEETKDQIPGYGVTHHWTKRSIFWDLPYWSSNLIRHNLDVMHVEKNVFDNIFNTVMDVKGKTKDSANARDDMAIHCRRPSLELVNINGKFSKPKASYVLNVQERKAVCEWVKILRFPDGYVSNIASCVTDDGKFVGLKSHDCHVFMQRLVPLAFREFLPKPIWETLSELSLFFREICAIGVDVFQMDIAESSIVVLLCKLEKIFPPSFFDSMEHLIMHLPYEAKVGGPVQYRWMYPFERCMFHLKRKVKNKARVEGSIAEAYITEEISNFTSMYFDPSLETRRTKVSRNDDGGGDDDIKRLSIFNLSGLALGRARIRELRNDFDAVETFVLLNCSEVDTYIWHFEMGLRKSNPQITDDQITKTCQTQFRMWFKEMGKLGLIEDTLLHRLSFGPKVEASCYNGITINGYRFHTEEHANGRSTTNSGVCVKGKFSGDDELDYFGIIQEVLQVSYTGYRNLVYILRCRWFDLTPGRGIRTDKFGGIDINRSISMNSKDPFIFAAQAQQVYYAPYPHIGSKGIDWWAVYKVRPRLFDPETYMHERDVETSNIEATRYYQEQLQRRSPASVVIEDEPINLVDIDAELEEVDGYTRISQARNDDEFIDNDDVELLEQNVDDDYYSSSDR